MTAYWEWGGSSTRFFTLGTRWHWIDSCKLRLLYRHKRRSVQFDRRRCRTKSWSGRCDEKKNLCPLRERNRGRPVYSPVTVLTELLWLHFLQTVWTQPKITALLLREIFSYEDSNVKSIESLLLQFFYGDWQTYLLVGWYRVFIFMTQP